MDPLVSILIPAFNAESTLAEALRSALGQTWPRKEIVIVDDGSKDATLSVANKFARENLCIFSQQNRGAAAARNKAFSLCRGDYIQWLDADDVLAPNKIAKQLEVLRPYEGNEVLACSAWGSFFHCLDRSKFTPGALWCDLPPVEWLIRKFETGQFMQTATWLVSRKLTEAAGPWDTRLLGDDDGEYFCRVALASQTIKFVPESRVFYRKPGPKSLSYIRFSNRKMDAHLLSMELTISHLRAVEDSERVRRACVSYLQCWMSGFYPERMDIVERMHELALALGGRLNTPQLPWKYAWIEKLFGWPAARLAQIFYNRLKILLLRYFDKALRPFNQGHRLEIPGHPVEMLESRLP
jgi:glycosyltransferase involved in cell wall biosynthesis